MEFQIAVAVDAGIGGLTGFVAAHKAPDDLIFKILLEIEYIVGHPQPLGHAPGILHIIQGAAGGFLPLSQNRIVKQPHGGADAAIAFLLHQIGGNGAVHAAAHADEHCVCLLGQIFGDQSVFHGIPPC